jgi:hypothetical protein
VVRALALAPLPQFLLRGSAQAVDYASAAEVFAAIDTLSAAVAARLGAMADRVPEARAFARSAERDRAQFQAERARLRKRLGVAPAGPAAAARVNDPLSLEALRVDQEALVHAHAEGLPALRDARAVDVLAGHMVELARHLTVIEMWIEVEESRG